MDSTMQAQPAFSVKEVFSHAWAVAKKYWTNYLLVGLVSFGILIAFGIVRAMFVGGIGLALGDSTAGAVISFLVGVPFFFVQYIIQAVLIVAFIRLSFIALAGGEIDYKKLFVHKDYWLILFILLTSIVYSFVVGFGMLLFIVPGVLAAIAFSMSFFVVIDKEKNPIEALQISYSLTQGNWLNIFLAYLAQLGLMFLSYLPIMILGGGPLVLGIIAASMRGDAGQALGVIAIILGIIGVLIGGAALVVLSFIVNVVAALVWTHIYNVLSKKNPGAFDLKKA